MSMVQNRALWMEKRGGPMRVGPAPYTAPSADEIVVRVRAVAMNPVDGIPGVAYRLIMPWLRFPTVLGGDVAGEVVEVGGDVTRFKPGDRVVGNAFGLEANRNRAAEGAFQHYVVLMQHMVSPIPDSLSFEQASVLPLTLATAATGLFQKDHLGLAMPSVDAAPRNETVFVWGGSTSVGSNAIQLARCAGYRVVTTASARNFEYARSLGAVAAVDYHSKTVVNDIVEHIGDSPLAGTLAVTMGSLAPSLSVVQRTKGSRRIAAAFPAVAVRLQTLFRRRRGVEITAIWGGTLKDNEVGPGIYVDFLPAALAAGRYRAAPPARVVGHGLESIPDAIKELQRGVSATKIVVTLLPRHLDAAFVIEKKIVNYRIQRFSSPLSVVTALPHLMSSEY